MWGCQELEGGYYPATTSKSALIQGNSRLSSQTQEVFSASTFIQSRVASQNFQILICCLESLSHLILLWDSLGFIPSLGEKNIITRKNQRGRTEEKENSPGWRSSSLSSSNASAQQAEAGEGQVGQTVCVDRRWDGGEQNPCGVAAAALLPLQLCELLQDPLVLAASHQASEIQNSNQVLPAAGGRGTHVSRLKWDFIPVEVIRGHQGRSCVG